MGRAWIRNLLERADVELVGLVDPMDEARSQALAMLPAELAPRVRCGADVGEMLDALQPDFLLDVTIPDAHCGVTCAALDRGIPVLGEKPMAATLEQGRRMVEASRRSGALYMVSQSRRFDGRLQAVCDAVLRGEIGQLHTLNVDFYVGAHFDGFRAQMQHPLLLDMAIHTLDAARAIAGDAVPHRVFCRAFNPPGSWYAGMASASALFEMTGRDGSAIHFCYCGSWCSEGHRTSWEGSWRCIGTKGTLLWDGYDGISVATPRPTAQLVWEDDVRPVESQSGAVGIRGSLGAFLEALRSGQLPACHAEDNIHSLAMTLAAMQSADTGQPVEIQTWPVT